MSDREQRCWNCRFWGDPPAAFRPSGEGDEPVHGDYEECTRLPPAVVRFVPYGNGPGGFNLAEHALTDACDWCGEWQAASPRTADDAATVMARAVLAGDVAAGRALADKLIELVVIAPEPPA